MTSENTINFHNCKIIRNNKVGKYKYSIILDRKTNLIYLQVIFQQQFESLQEKEIYLSCILKISQISAHPSILPIISYQYYDNTYHFPTVTTNYMANGTLSEVFEKIHKTGLQSFTGTKKYINFIGISIGMRFFYFNFIIHGNLNSNQIFLDENYYPHILNCEIHKDTTDEELYIKRIKAQSDDVYSFALIAYELITGKKPLSERELQENKERKIKLIPDLSIIQSEWLQAFLQNSLSSDFFRKPFFSVIYKDIIQHKSEFETVFGEIDDNEVSEYISIINDYFISFAKKVKKKADEGDMKSIFALGNLLYFGYGINENKAEAAKYFKIVADQGRTNAMYYYALMLKKGEGIQKDHKEAAKYFKMSADLGHPDAINSYGLILDDGVGIEQNKEEAAKYYKRASELGNLVAMNNYGLMLDNGTGVPVNKAEAVKYYKMAAEEGNTSGMMNYVVALYNGEGVSKDVNEAIRYLKMATDQGNECAMFCYAQALDFGDGIQIDKKTAAKYYKRAADRGYVDAMLYIGDMLEKGEGIEMDKFEAARYYKMGAYNGDEKAMEAYKRISQTLFYSI